MEQQSPVAPFPEHLRCELPGFAIRQGYLKVDCLEWLFSSDRFDLGGSHLYLLGCEEVAVEVYPHLFGLWVVHNLLREDLGHVC